MESKDYLKYKKQIKKMLPKNYPQHDRLMQNIENMLTEYMEQNTSATYEDLIRDHGAPEELIAQLIENLSSDDILSMFKKHRRKCMIIMVIIAVVLVALICIFIVCVVQNTSVSITESTVIYQN